MEMVGERGLDGWLVADFRRNNPILNRLLGLGSGVLSRRCFLWLPPAGRGEPAVLASRVDGHTFAGLPCHVELYGGFEEMADRLGALLPQGGRVAMEYTERGALPTISRVDAGLVELVRGLGVEVVSSGGLISRLEVWDERRLALHERAALGVDEARALALRRCAEALRSGEAITEGALAALILASFESNGLASADVPDVAVNAHSADPHYSAGDRGGATVGRDSVLLIDLLSKVRDVEDAPYADSTWMAYTGPTPPPDLVRAFEAVRAARDTALARIDAAAQEGREIAGREVDRVARSSIAAAGLEQALMHRTGHSLGADHVHGVGTNLDDVEFPDDRPLVRHSGFTVEPGLYWPGRFGVRLEVSATLTPEGMRVTTERQDELTLLA
jgi:Xaa-Pro aminopeptidase